MQKESGFGSFGLICFQCFGMLGCWEGLRSMKKQSQSCREGGLRKRERDGGKCVVGLESRAAVCNGSRVWQTLLLLCLGMVRAPACLVGK